MPTTRSDTRPNAAAMKPIGPASETTPMTIAAQPSQRGRTGRRTIAIPAARYSTDRPKTAAINKVLSKTLSVCRWKGRLGRIRPPSRSVISTVGLHGEEILGGRDAVVTSVALRWVALCCSILSEFVVSVSKVLDERVDCGSRLIGPIACETTHRSQPGFQPAVVTLDAVVGVLLVLWHASGRPSSTTAIGVVAATSPANATVAPQPFDLVRERVGRTGMRNLTIESRIH